MFNCNKGMHGIFAPMVNRVWYEIRSNSLCLHGGEKADASVRGCTCFWSCNQWFEGPTEKEKWYNNQNVRIVFPHFRPLFLILFVSCKWRIPRLGTIRIVLQSRGGDVHLNHGFWFGPQSTMILGYLDERPKHPSWWRSVCALPVQDSPALFTFPVCAVLPCKFITKTDAIVAALIYKAFPP